MTSKTLQARKDRLARNKAKRNKRIEGKNRITRNAERDKRIERLYFANCSGSPMNALDICRVLQAVNRAIALNPESPQRSRGHPTGRRGSRYRAHASRVVCCARRPPWCRHQHWNSRPRQPIARPASRTTRCGATRATPRPA
jgi:hypothetical protein